MCPVLEASTTGQPGTYCELCSPGDSFDASSWAGLRGAFLVAQMVKNLPAV